MPISESSFDRIPASSAGDRAGQADDDAGEDDQRDAVADAALADLLTEPHDEGATGGQGQDRQQPEGPARTRHQGGAARSRRLLQEERDAGRLDDRHQHRAVARVLGDLLAAELALLRELLEVGPHHRQQLQDDRRRDVRHDAEREDGDPLEASARERVHEAEEGALHGRHELDQRLRIHPRRRNVTADPIDREQPESEHQALAQIRDREDIAQAFDHEASSSQRPPAASILVRADLLNLWAVTVTAACRSPLPRTLTLLPGWTRPCSASSSGVTRLAERRESRDVDHRVLDPELVGETPLRDAPNERHLAALESGTVAVTGARLAALVTLSGGLAEAGTGAAADALARMLAAWGGGKLVQFHFASSTNSTR